MSFSGAGRLPVPASITLLAQTRRRSENKEEVMDDLRFAEPITLKFQSSERKVASS